MITVAAAPGIPSGLRYGRSMFGMFRRNRMNDTPWNAYEIIAPNTAMLSSVAPMTAPPFSAPERKPDRHDDGETEGGAREQRDVRCLARAMRDRHDRRIIARA